MPPHELVKMGMVAPMPMPPKAPAAPPVDLPRRGERGTEWRSFAVDQAGVDAELAVVAPGFGLISIGEHVWSCRDEYT